MNLCCYQSGPGSCQIQKLTLFNLKNWSKTKIYVTLRTSERNSLQCVKKNIFF